jgi:Rap1a immunity proteins
MRSFLLILACMVAGPAYAQDTAPERSLESLVKRCRAVLRVADSGIAANDGDLEHCIGYLQGFTEGYETATTFRTKTICLPSGVSNAQVARVVVRYLEDNPERLDHPRFMGVLTALSVKFPCRRP